MKLSLQTFSQLLQSMASAVQGASAQLIDLSAGSVLRAILEANASIALWMQWLIVQVLRMTRASTSAADDLDSWMRDFAFNRLPATASSGLVVFSRLVPSLGVFIPVGVNLKTADGAQVFTVIAGGSNQSWNAERNGYDLAPGTASASVPVSAQVPGLSGNVQADTITILASAVPGIDEVSNPAPTVGGLDAETDDAFRARFRQYLASLSRATVKAAEYAIATVQQGLHYVIQENVDSNGNRRPGNFIVVVDDGTGHPSQALMSVVASAVDRYRPVGSTFSVQAPTIISANIALNIAIAQGTSRQQVIADVGNGLMRYVNGLSIGAVLSITRIAQAAYQASSAVTNVFAITINGQDTDLTPGSLATVKANSVVVS